MKLTPIGGVNSLEFLLSEKCVKRSFILEKFMCLKSKIGN